jgi:hypothetical protein
MKSLLIKMGYAAKVIEMEINDHLTAAQKPRFLSPQQSF